MVAPIPSRASYRRVTRRLSVWTCWRAYSTNAFLPAAIRRIPQCRASKRMPLCDRTQNKPRCVRTALRHLARYACTRMPLRWASCLFAFRCLGRIASRTASRRLGSPVPLTRTQHRRLVAAARSYACLAHISFHICYKQMRTHHCLREQAARLRYSAAAVPQYCCDIRA